LQLMTYQLTGGNTQLNRNRPRSSIRVLVRKRVAGAGAGWGSANTSAQAVSRIASTRLAQPGQTSYYRLRIAGTPICEVGVRDWVPSRAGSGRPQLISWPRRCHETAL